MKKIKSLLLSLATAALLLSCGDAGVQVRIGDDFETEFDVIGASSFTAINLNLNTTIESETAEYGDLLQSVDISELTISFQDYSGSTTGQITVTIAGEVFDTGTGFPFEQGSTFTFSNVVPLSNIANQIEQSGDLGISLSASSADPFGDSDFKFIVSLRAEAIVGEND